MRGARWVPISMVGKVLSFRKMGAYVLSGAESISQRPVHLGTETFEQPDVCKAMIAKPRAPAAGQHPPGSRTQAALPSIWEEGLCTREGEVRPPWGWEWYFQS